MKRVIREVAKAFKITEGQLMGDQKWHPLALARHVAMVLCLESYPLESTKIVAKRFRRTRSMCSHAIIKVNNACETNPKVKRTVNSLRKKLFPRLDRKRWVA